MGQSWRIGVDPSETTTLVRHGVFARVRNPIFTAMLIFAAGITLMTPNPLALAAFLVLLVTIELQVRVVEEPYSTRPTARPTATTVKPSAGLFPTSDASETSDRRREVTHARTE